MAYPTSGQAAIAGYDVVRERPRLKLLIAVCPQDINLDKELTAYENLWFYGRLYRVADLSRRIEELLDWGQLAHRARDQVKKFSGGMQRRLLIVRALLSRPRVLFLDEPTVGLDPQIRRQLWDLIRHLKGQGITVLLTTHYIEEAEMLCDRVAIQDRVLLRLAAAWPFVKVTPPSPPPPGEELDWNHVWSNTRVDFEGWT